MSDEDAADLLEDVLDHWAAGGTAPERARTLDHDAQGSAGQRQRAQSGGDPFGIGTAFKVVDLGLPEDPGGVPAYAVQLARTFLPDGRPLPMLTLECETAGAGIADLRRRTGWQPWDMRTVPELDFTWRLRADIASRSLQCLTRVDAEGFDELPHLWDASETVSLPENFWNLLDTAQHALVAGPVKSAADEGALRRAADAGELLAVAARIRFL